MTTQRHPMRTLGMIARAVYGIGQAIPQCVVDLLPVSPLAALGLMQQRNEVLADDVGELIAGLPADPGQYAGDSFGMGQFWVGYYRYLTAMDLSETHGPDALRACGEALYGDRWQSDLSRALGLSDPRRMRAWMARERPIPAGVWCDLAALLRAREISVASVLRDITGGG